MKKGWRSAGVTVKLCDMIGLFGSSVGGRGGGVFQSPIVNSPSPSVVKQSVASVIT